ncbi:uncharacterized protein [Leptinotarsa decemlineata]|uniref:uncharacterized protein n=1 Tax=Leptinotarsa decemlineata TaxID=7539 RepID=UPI003D307325
MNRTQRIMQLCSNITEDDNVVIEKRNTCGDAQPQPGGSGEQAYSETADYARDYNSTDEDPFEAGSSDEYLPSSEGDESDVDSDLNDRNVDITVLNGDDNIVVEVVEADLPDQSDEVKKKRKRNVSGWKKNVINCKRLKEEYVGFKNQIHPSRPMLPSPCLEKSKHKCSGLMREEDRKTIYNEFRSFQNIDDQRQFVVTHVEQKLKKRTTRNIENSRKHYTNHYSLTVNNNRVSVCRMFLWRL